MNELDKRSSTLPTTDLTNEFWGSSNLDRSDFSLPRVVIGQPTSENKEAGKFHFNNGMSYERIDTCKLIVPQKTRVLYSGLSKQSVCGSDDFYTPSSRFSKPISESCMNCPAQAWDYNQVKAQLIKQYGIKSSVDKPICHETYNLIMAGKGWDLFAIQFQKSQLKIVQEKLFSRLQAMNEKPPYAVSFDMSLREVSGNQTKYYVVVFDNFTYLEGDEGERGYELWRRYSKVARDILAKQHAQMDAEHAKEEAPPDIPFPEEVSSDEEIPF